MITVEEIPVERIDEFWKCKALEIDLDCCTGRQQKVDSEEGFHGFIRNI